MTLPKFPKHAGEKLTMALNTALDGILACAGKHRAHDRGPSCRLGRCAGHTKKEVVEKLESAEQKALLEEYEDTDIVSVHLPEGRGEHPRPNPKTTAGFRKQHYLT